MGQQGSCKIVIRILKAEETVDWQVYMHQGVRMWDCTIVEMLVGVQISIFVEKKVYDVTAAIRLYDLTVALQTERILQVIGAKLYGRHAMPYEIGVKKNNPTKLQIFLLMHIKFNRR